MELYLEWSLFTCLARWLGCLNDAGQEVHEYRWFGTWTRVWCLLRPSEKAKASLHSVHK